VEAPEVFRLVMTIAILPWFIALVIRLRDARDYAFLAFAFFALCLADVATVIERGFGVQAMDVVQHALFATAGILSVIGVLAVRRRVLARVGRA
jgi:hypothetical protein